MRPQGDAEQVLVHDFPQLGQGKAIPYGTYDVAEDRDLINVGIAHDLFCYALKACYGQSQQTHNLLVVNLSRTKPTMKALATSD